MKKSAFWILAVLLALTVLFVACDDTDDPQPPSGSTEQTTAALDDGTTAPGREDTNEPGTEDESKPGTEPHVHAFSEWTVVKNATCTEMGERERACACGVIEKQGLGAHGHAEVMDAAVAPTCTESGLTEGIHCFVCNEVLVAQEKLAAPGHDYGDWYTIVEPSCTRVGTEARDCARCGERQEQGIAAIGHTYTATVVEPTCQAEGYIRYDCDCGCYYIEWNADQLGHSESEPVFEVIYEPKCQSQGKSCKVIYCLTCGEELDRETVWIDALGHTEVIDPAVEATCITDGKTEGSHCSVCNQTLVWQETIYATGVHVYVDEVCKYCSAEIVYSEGLKFVSNGDGTCYVSDIGTCKDQNVVIPKTSPEGDIVTCIGSGAFSPNSRVDTVTIPDTVTEIGAIAFSRCWGLFYVNIPDSVTSIGSGAFSDTEITSIVIPDSVTFMGDAVFEGCNELESVTLPNGMTSIGDRMFYCCGDLESITIPDTVTSIGEEAFCYCDGLTELIIPNSVMTIGVKAFSACDSLESITVVNGNSTYHSTQNCIIETASNTLIAGCKTSIIPTDGSVTSIGDYAFYDCTGLIEIEIPESITSIGYAAFMDCEDLYSITIPNSVISIGAYAFASCTDMRTVTIGNGVSYIGEDAFHSCYCINGVYIQDLSAWCAISFETPTSNPVIQSEKLYLDDELITELTIPDDVTSIGQYAFIQCKALTSLTVPGNLTSIDQSAFDSCTGLTSVVISGSVTYIGEYAFTECNNLVSVTVSEGTTSIEEYAFFDCPVLTNVSIPDSVVFLGGYSFAFCPGLEYTEYEGVKYLGNEKNPYVVLVEPTDKTQTTYTVHADTKHIYSEAFEGCTNLTSIVIPKGVITIGVSAFYKCAALTEINIPDSVTIIADDAFYECVGLTSVSIPKGVISIGDRAFYKCSGLTEVVISDSVKTIGANAFYRCDSLTNVTLGNDLESIGNGAFRECGKLTEIVLPESLTDIGEYAFFYCKELSGTVHIPGNVKTIGNSTFAHCEYLNGVTFGEGVEVIGDYAFGSCLRLSSNIIIPDGVTSIGDGAFSHCSHVSEIVIPDSVVTIGRSAFSSVYAKKITFGSGVTFVGEWAFFGSSADVYITDIYAWCNITFEDEHAHPGSSIYLNGELLSDLVIPDGVTAIGDYAFYHAGWINSVVIPDSVTSIGDYAFYDTNLEQSIMIPDSVTSIGDYAFAHCWYITDVAIPGSVKTIGKYAFWDCYDLMTVTLGNGVEVIGEGAFKDCKKLISINIPESVTSIGREAFYHCESLSSEIVIPDGVTVIGADAFWGCNSIPRIVIGNNVTEIGEGAFGSCDAWSGTVIIPAGVQTIGADAFSYCRNLEYMIIEKGDLVYIGASNLGEDILDHSSFNRIYYAGSAEDWANITIEIEEKNPWIDKNPLFDTAPYYYSATMPQDKGNYWYYDENGEIKIWNLDEVSYKAEEYSEKFVNSTFGQATDSYSSQFLDDLQDDFLFQTQISVWEGLHIVAESSWDSKSLSKEDTYKIVIYDLLVGKVGTQANLLDYMDVAGNSYMYEFAKFFLTDDSITNLDALKGVDQKSYDYETFADYYFGSMDGVLQVFDEAADLYDALYVCAQYQVLSDMDEYFYEILCEISSDSTLPRDLRNAAWESTTCYRNATDEMLQEILLQEYVSNKSEDIWNMLEEKLWDEVLTSVFPGFDIVQLALKGVMFLVDGGFNLDAINEAYYQLEAAVGLENALRNVIKDTEPDYLRYEMAGEAEYYMYAVNKYKTSVLLGYDYSTALLQELYKGASASEKHDYAAQMEDIAAQKQEKQELYDQFDTTISQGYAEYYR